MTGPLVRCVSITKNKVTNLAKRFVIGDHSTRIWGLTRGKCIANGVMQMRWK